MNTEEKNRYFQELTLNLQHGGFAVKLETEDGLLPVELDGQRLWAFPQTRTARWTRLTAGTVCWMPSKALW